MEFLFNVEGLLMPDSDGFAIVDGSNPPGFMRNRQVGINAHRTSSFFENQGNGQNASPAMQLEEIIDKMGTASAKAQKLPSIITSSMKFFNTDNKIFFRVVGNQVIGFIKMGKRNLFYRGVGGQIKEIKPLCVLDFYVHESVQRGGHGKALFEIVL